MTDINRNPFKTRNLCFDPWKLWCLFFKNGHVNLYKIILIGWNTYLPGMVKEFDGEF